MVSRFAEPGKQGAQAGRGRAFTYDTSLVPSGAGVDVEQRTDGRGTTVILRVAGLAAGHGFGAHVHTGTCAADPAAAGGHYQNRRDPEQPSKDAAYANERNEVWLDLRTDDRGAGTAKARHTWHFRPGEARSVVLHEAPGGAGERVACFTVPFRGQ
ncbi:superoxide dismutase family protein [Streptomyces sp. NPDC049954]|uniref:superoxide dismutase family protein n=1 Tax=Streptomyces sp. NPDC049954 TaxID=3155779 RepID=UPI00341C0864